MKRILLFIFLSVSFFSASSQVIGFCSNSGGGNVTFTDFILNGGNSYTLVGRLHSNGNRAIYITVRCGGWTGVIAAETTNCILVNGTSGGTPFTFTFTTTCAPAFQYINIGVAPQNQCGAARQNSTLQPCNGVLPVELKEFRASLKGKNASLKWITSMEKNSKEFVLQRKTSGDFVDLVTIPSKNSISGAEYSFEDEAMSKGVNQYRLKMVDLDGTIKFSEIRIVRGNAAPSFSMYPNPGNANTKITLNESGAPVDVVIFNSNGKVVKRFNSLRETSVSVGTLSTGVYLVKVINKETGEASSQKLSINP